MSLEQPNSPAHPIRPLGQTDTARANAPIAAFDVDGTLTWADSFTLFLRFAVGRSGFFIRLVRLTPSFFAYGFKQISRATLKERIIAAFFSGMDVARYQALCADYARFIYPIIARPDALARLRAHQGIQDRVVFVSASLQDYLACWAKDLGVEAVLATRVEMVGGKLTGRLDGPNCWGPQKIAAIQGTYGEVPLVAAYGDTRGDKEMLAAAQNPGYRLFEEAPSGHKAQIWHLYLGNQMERWRANQS